MDISEKTIARLSLYRSLLKRLASDGVDHVYSHELGKLAGATAAQVRRDLMAVGCEGSPKRGYGVQDLIDSIGEFLDGPEGLNVALVGVGNLGQAIIAFFAGRVANLSVVAAFDNDPYKTGRVIRGCRCYPIDEVERIVREQHIGAAILTVPADEAQGVAETLVRAGVRGILNFAPIKLRLPPYVYVEDVDMGMLLEKVAYFARQHFDQEG